MTGSFDHVSPELLLRAYKHLANTFIEHQIRHMELIRESQERFRALETMLADPEPVPANLEELVEAIQELTTNADSSELQEGEPTGATGGDDAPEPEGTDDGDPVGPAIASTEGGHDLSEPKHRFNSPQWYTPNRS